MPDEQLQFVNQVSVARKLHENKNLQVRRTDSENDEAEEILENLTMLKSFYHHTMHLNSVLFIMVPVYTFYLFFMVIKADSVSLFTQRETGRKNALKSSSPRITSFLTRNCSGKTNFYSQ